ncbi:hypothetical protein CW751_11340 [Brumimicrobium salinarum]|uniref:Lipoprotein n=1 Tax=Brumimicrobium salinarum TaxID=2058658 RepID=A0A2I0R0H0_9FLAO|nr:hypothetical protein [Brumimicrobium salinarum]PKR80092.1 hypothetical protein CW751_11340 [Brumimicrobium salinarum]
MFKKYIYSSAVIFFALTSCNTEQEKLKDVSKEDVTVTSEEDTPKNEIVYAIPSPNDQYDLLRSLSEEVKKEIVNPLSAVNNYTTIEKQALNFGVYLSDAAYLLRYEQGKKVFLDYLSSLDKLGQNIDITKIYGEELIEEIENVGADDERLYEISSENYISIYDQLIENEKGAELSMILAGSWIETMYILFNTAEEYDKHYEIEEYIIDQRYVLENLIGFIKNYDQNDGVTNVLAQLNQINSVYEDMDCQESNLEIEEKEGTVMLNGGLSCVFDESTFTKMKSTVFEIRNSIVS